MAAVVEPERLVFVDECGTHTSLAPIYGYAPRGQRLRLRVPRKRGKNTTLLSSMTLEGVGPCLAVVGSTTREVFETYVERVLSPTLKPGQIVVMDNLSAHKGNKIRGADRGTALRDVVPAALLTRPQPDRGSIRQGKGLAKTSGCAYA